MVNFAVFLPIGPGQNEIDRAADLLDSIRFYEPQIPWLVFVDDAQEDRQLVKKFSLPKNCTAVSLVNPRRGGGVGDRGGLCVANMVAFSWIHEYTDASFVLKMDSDALVISPFAQKIQQAFEISPEVGIIGSAHKLSCNGEKRNVFNDGYSMRKLHSPFAVWREPLKPGQHIQVSLWGKLKTIRTHVREAINQGYCFGEHCQGGAYAVSIQLIRRMAVRGYLQDPMLWVDVPCCEDVMMGMYARAVGLQLKDFNDKNNIFGIQHVGLADTPNGMLERGYSVIHSIKNDPNFSEEQIRTFYRQRRAVLVHHGVKNTFT